MVTTERIYIYTQCIKSSPSKLKNLLLIETCTTYPSLSEQFNGTMDPSSSAGQPLLETIGFTNVSSHWSKQSPTHKGIDGLFSLKMDEAYVINTFRSREEFREETKVLMGYAYLL